MWMHPLFLMRLVYSHSHCHFSVLLHILQKQMDAQNVIFVILGSFWGSFLYLQTTFCPRKMNLSSINLLTLTALNQIPKDIFKHRRWIFWGGAFVEPYTQTQKQKQKKTQKTFMSKKPFSSHEGSVWQLLRECFSLLCSLTGADRRPPYY